MTIRYCLTRILIVSSGASDNLLFKTALSSCILLRMVFHELEGVRDHSALTFVGQPDVPKATSLLLCR